MTGRPCTCDRVRVGERYVRGRDCPACWRWHHSPRHRERWGGDPADCTPAPPAASADCPHFAAFTPDERAARGLRPDRRTGLCALGYGTADRVVCVCWASPSGCKGCPRTPPG